MQFMSEYADFKSGRLERRIEWTLEVDGGGNGIKNMVRMVKVTTHTTFPEGDDRETRTETWEITAEELEQFIRERGKRV